MWLSVLEIGAALQKSRRNHGSLCVNRSPIRCCHSLYVSSNDFLEGNFEYKGKMFKQQSARRYLRYHPVRKMEIFLLEKYKKHPVDRGKSLLHSFLKEFTKPFASLLVVVYESFQPQALVGKFDVLDRRRLTILKKKGSSFRNIGNNYLSNYKTSLSSFHCLYWIV